MLERELALIWFEKMSTACGSPAGEPPVQLFGFDQRFDSSPVHICVEKTKRSSNGSRHAQQRLRRRPAGRASREGFMAGPPCRVLIYRTQSATALSQAPTGNGNKCEQSRKDRTGT